MRLSYPINDRWFLTAFDEIIIGLQEPLFDQNRLYGALGYTMSKSISLQLGYLKHHFTGASFDRMVLGVWITNDFRKKKKR